MGVMRRIGTSLIAERKAEAMFVAAFPSPRLVPALMRIQCDRLEAAQGEKLATSRARDLLSLLVRANTAADARQRLSDEDVLARAFTPCRVISTA
jgi:hypothetical protein